MTKSSWRNNFDEPSLRFVDRKSATMVNSLGKLEVEILIETSVVDYKGFGAMVDGLFLIADAHLEVSENIFVAHEVNRPNTGKEEEEEEKEKEEEEEEKEKEEEEEEEEKVVEVVEVEKEKIFRPAGAAAKSFRFFVSGNAGRSILTTDPEEQCSDCPGSSKRMEGSELGRGGYRVQTIGDINYSINSLMDSGINFHVFELDELLRFCGGSFSALIKPYSSLISSVKKISGWKLLENACGSHKERPY
ncbi:hypothetical protein V1478_006445 [Vespula squamosa]|uniref:Uncharacterized protein n=1 Tax=Vespula squamosa TaxID=30214 RepID=A0ABD2B7W7_VESSQ